MNLYTKNDLAKICGVTKAVMDSLTKGKPIRGYEKIQPVKIEQTKYGKNRYYFSEHQRELIEKYFKARKILKVIRRKLKTSHEEEKK